ncbi:MAG: glucose-1-phosphate thymidylyltransferase RfbA [Actinomycetota bacterium]|nr:glucose-1-phosphate thymidylyltransferase [Acidimicrobiaceae bacterium]MCS5674125.1 glucose-1-phosphate thymidylyltransferase RfbA [Acidimicrobiales bacterium]MED5540934.1 glucose-1-phosphate thymidylyltransferase RfbA [Actinomycetota bacterium]MEE2806837.1 glucose-1-phosphate thymidylyltransferase RfbA [Actinomycetota bacterium]|tara:strand:- start:650 stop:1510 length:861 start_codon:yes stop_codon:yes gene_type:complete
MRGMMLAGGAGTRLFPLSRVSSKQLQPVYDKPMIYYPLATLMNAGIREIHLISTPHDLPVFREVLGDGHQWGVDLSYGAQPEPGGIAQAVVIGENFIQSEPFTLVLGDNIFHGPIGLGREVANHDGGAVIWGYPVDDPQRYGVIEFDEFGAVLSIEEKPDDPRSHLAVPGLYVYDGTAVVRAKDLKPSARGELEITDLNLSFLNDGELRAVELERNITWLDSGTHESLLDSSNFIAAIEKRQGYKVACLEEVAFNMGFVSGDEIAHTIEAMPRSPYRSYCERAILG